MIKLKRGQGLPLNTIIIAAIVLIVLVIIIMIFTGRIGVFRQGVEECANNGGICTRDVCNADNQRQVNYGCDLDGDGTYNEGRDIDGICCISI